MKTITITHEAHSAVRAQTLPGYIFNDTSTLNPDGTHTVPVSDDNANLLSALSHSTGLSISDVILYFIQSVQSKGRPQ